MLNYIFIAIFNLFTSLFFPAALDDQRPKKCETCQKTFKNVSQLNQHIKNNHQLQIQVKCKICKKDYKNKTKLLEHVNYLMRALDGKQKKKMTNKNQNETEIRGEHALPEHGLAYLKNYKLELKGLIDAEEEVAEKATEDMEKSS